MPEKSPYAGASLVIDTNVAIAAESHEFHGRPPGAAALALLRRCTELGITVWKSETSFQDLAHDRDNSRRSRILTALERYPTLARVVPTPELLVRAGYASNISGNDHLDAELLAALDNHAVNWLVTEDVRLARHARRAGLGERVLRCEEMLELLRPVESKAPTYPSVDLREGYEVPLNAPILITLRQDYEGFELWWQKVQAEHRDLLVIGDPLDPDALAVLKPESPPAYGLRSPLLKLCTFKVSEDLPGLKLGEHLLKAVVEYARHRDFSAIYVEVLGHHEVLLAWLKEFGFAVVPDAHTAREGEVVLVKDLYGEGNLSPLEHAIAHGPGAALVPSAYAVPIYPDWARQLLPEGQRAVGLGIDWPSTACGNAIRKAYLCVTPARSFIPGDLLVFYQTKPDQLFTVTGVLERVVVTSDPLEILEAIGARSVYSPDQVVTMCERGQVVAMLFRFDRVLQPPLTLSEMIEVGGLAAPPQSVTQIQGGGLAWLRAQLDA